MDENPTSLPNYNLHLPEHESDNGGDAVELAQFYMRLDKEGDVCPHGVNYDTGEIHGKGPNRDYVLGAIPLNGSVTICPCCTRTEWGGNHNRDTAFGCRGGICSNCFGE